jgi:large conductance mechanosensitive channel
MPFLGWIIGDMDLSALNITLREAVMVDGAVQTPAVVIGIGSFIAVVIDFLLIAMVVFLMVKVMSSDKRLSLSQEAVKFMDV